MEMISILRFRILLNKLNNNKLYNNFLVDLIKKKINLNGLNHIYLRNFIPTNIVYLLISSDQGLCGNLNLGLVDKVLDNIIYNKFYNKSINFWIIGKKKIFLDKKIFSKYCKFNILHKKISLFKNINNIDLIIKMIINYYKINVNTYFYIVNNIFLNKRIFSTKINKLIPISINNYLYNVNYVYEEDNFLLIDNLLNKYLNSIIYNNILNNMVSEYSSRILITKNASKNANDLYKKLNNSYNKLRQFKVTNEIIELFSSL